MFWLGVETVFAFGAIAAAGTFFLDYNHVASDRNIFPYDRDDCPIGWEAPEVDAARLAAGFREVYLPIVEARNSLESQRLGSAEPVEETDQDRAVRSAFGDLEQYTRGGLAWQPLERADQVACDDELGSSVINEYAYDTLGDLQEAGYDIDLLTGEVSYPA
jgi:hypothetical protein